MKVKPICALWNFFGDQEFVGTLFIREGSVPPRYLEIDGIYYEKKSQDEIEILKGKELKKREQA